MGVFERFGQAAFMLRLFPRATFPIESLCAPAHFQAGENTMTIPVQNYRPFQPVERDELQACLNRIGGHARRNETAPERPARLFHDAWVLVIFAAIAVAIVGLRVIVWMPPIGQ
jgi:hypothetical protein